MESTGQAVLRRTQLLCARFFTFVMVLLCAFFTLLYVIGAIRFTGGVGRFSRVEVPHFLGALAAAVATVMYAALHFLPRKRYRLMYALTAALLIAVALESQSLGLTGPTVDDCDEDPLAFGGKLRDEIKSMLPIPENMTYSATGGGKAIVTTKDGKKITHEEHKNALLIEVGRLGQPLDRCADQTLIFAATLLLAFCHSLALFDVQRMLLNRVKARTYGERFIEMGVA